MLNVPQEDPTIPDAVKNAVEKAKNLVTHYESEAKRLAQMVASEEYTVTELNKRKVELEEQIAKLEKDCEAKFAEYESLANSSVLAGEAFQEAEKARDEMISQTAQLDREAVEREKELLERERMCDEAVAGARETALDLSNREREVSMREERIKQFTQGL